MLYVLRLAKKKENLLLATPTFLLLARFNLFSLVPIKTDDDAMSHIYSGIHKYVHTHTHTHADSILYFVARCLFLLFRYISWFVWHIAQSARSHVDATAAATPLSVCLVGGGGEVGKEWVVLPLGICATKLQRRTQCVQFCNWLDS